MGVVEHRERIRDAEGSDFSFAEARRAEISGLMACLRRVLPTTGLLVLRSVRDQARPKKPVQHKTSYQI